MGQKKGKVNFYPFLCRTPLALGQGWTLAPYWGKEAFKSPSTENSMELVEHKVLQSASRPKMSREKMP